MLTLAALLALTAVALTVGRVGSVLAPVRAVVRAAVQLAGIAGLIRLAFTDPRVAAVFVAVMLGAVAVTAGRRLGPGWRNVLRVLLASSAGAAPVLVVLLSTGAFPRTARYLISFAGIILGAT